MYLQLYRNMCPSIKFFYFRHKHQHFLLRGIVFLFFSVQLIFLCCLYNKLLFLCVYTQNWCRSRIEQVYCVIPMHILYMPVYSPLHMCVRHACSTMRLSKRVIHVHLHATVLCFIIISMGTVRAKSVST